MGNLNQVLGSGYNAAEVETQDSEPLTAGEYIVTVDSAELRQTKTGNGTGCNMAFEVVDGAASGRKVFNWFNLAHENQKAAQIGQAEFAALCKAVGVLTPQDTDELLGKYLTIRVVIKDGRNEVKAYKAAPTGEAPKLAEPQPQAKKVMPWQKK